MKNTGRQAAMRNRKGKSNTTSQYKGVRKRVQNEKVTWRSQIMDGKRNINLVAYETEDYAAKVYDAAAWMLFGADAHYNFSVGTPSQQHKEQASAHIERYMNKNETSH
jgi:hypothetical protein